MMKTKQVLKKDYDKLDSGFAEWFKQTLPIMDQPLTEEDKDQIKSNFERLGFSSIVVQDDGKVDATMKDSRYLGIYVKDILQDNVNCAVDYVLSCNKSEEVKERGESK